MEIMVDILIVNVITDKLFIFTFDPLVYNKELL